MSNQSKKSTNPSLTIFTRIGNRFKSLVVNNLSIDSFVFWAKIFPIGGWLVHERADRINRSSVLKALSDKNKKRLKNILSVASEEAIHQYMLAGDLLGITPINYATTHLSKDEQEKYLTILLKAIKPANRSKLLDDIRVLGEKYIFNLTHSSVNVIKTVMNLIPKNERFGFMNQADSKGETPLMWHASSGSEKPFFEAYLMHCTPEQKYELLIKVDPKGLTPMMRLVQCNTDDIDEAFIYLLKSIPKERRTDFLNHHKQGEKMMLLADITGKKRIKEILEKNDIPDIEVEAEGMDMEQRIECLNEQWEAEEGFKEKHGDYPMSLLEVQHVYRIDTDAKTNYRTKMKKFHPDKSKENNAKDISQKINSAYEFYDKPETRIQYIKR